eukprot:m.299343 g.299343  ORF g.299343 m.299343 type:complete len:533 (+) comp27234_c1_seq2:1565-3163(+)
MQDHDTVDEVSPVPLGVASFPRRNGSTVIPLVDGRPTFARLDELMSNATSSIWITVSFLDAERWRSPRGEPFFGMLGRHADRGVDVRVLIWRLEFDNPVLHKPQSTFFRPVPGVALPKNVKIRWDSSGPDHRHCHHEKTWVVDGDTDEPVVVEGGIVLNCGSIATPGHPLAEVIAGHDVHDVDVEIRGIAAGDVSTHFVQRWNAAHRHSEDGGHWPSLAAASSLAEPPRPRVCGSDSVQVLRTLRPGSATAGETSILAAYRAAITQARHTIYIEQQHIAHVELLELLEQACDRGVRVLYVVPSNPCVLTAYLPQWAALGVEAVLGGEYAGRAAASAMSSVAALLRWVLPSAPATTLSGEPLSMPSPDCDEAFLSTVPRLCRHPNFALAGLVSGGHPIYVHSKLMIVDDAYLVVGSANLVDLSLRADHTELAVAAWGSSARQLRDELYCEHADCQAIPHEHTENAVASLDWLTQRSVSNAMHLAAGEPTDGLLVELRGRLYGNVLFLVNTFFMEWRSRGAADRPLDPKAKLRE